MTRIPYLFLYWDGMTTPQKNSCFWAIEKDIFPGSNFYGTKPDADFAATTPYNFISFGYTIKIHRSTSYPRLGSRPFTRSKSAVPSRPYLNSNKKEMGKTTQRTTCPTCEWWWPQISHIQKRSRDKVCCQCPDFSSALIASNFIETTYLPILESPKEFQLPWFFSWELPSHKETKNGWGCAYHITR